MYDGHFFVGYLFIISQKVNPVANMGVHISLTRVDSVLCTSAWPSCTLMKGVSFCLVIVFLFVSGVFSFITMDLYRAAI